MRVCFCLCPGTLNWVKGGAGWNQKPKEPLPMMEATIKFEQVIKYKTTENLHMLTQSKLGIQKGKELHRHLSFLSTNKEELHCSQSNWRVVNYTSYNNPYLQINQEDNPQKNHKVTSKFPLTQFATSWFCLVTIIHVLLPVVETRGAQCQYFAIDSI